MLQNFKMDTLVVLNQLSSGSLALNLFQYNDTLTFIARITSFITFALFIWINSDRIMYKIKRMVQRIKKSKIYALFKEDHRFRFTIYFIIVFILWVTLGIISRR